MFLFLSTITRRPPAKNTVGDRNNAAAGDINAVRVRGGLRIEHRDAVYVHVLTTVKKARPTGTQNKSESM